MPKAGVHKVRNTQAAGYISNTSSCPSPVAMFSSCRNNGLRGGLAHVRPRLEALHERRQRLERRVPHEPKGACGLPTHLLSGTYCAR